MIYFFLVFLISFTSSAEELNELDSPFLFFERTACYGTCPQYIVKIYTSREIIYHGKMFVDKIGCFSSVLSLEQLSLLKTFINEVNFFSLEEKYDAFVSDLPSIITEVSINNEKHRVIDRFNGPVELEKIYQFIDESIMSIENWEELSCLD